MANAMEKGPFDGRRHFVISWSLIGRCGFSLVSVLLTQFSLCAVPYLFHSSSLFTLLCVSACLFLVLAGLGRCIRKLLRVRGSAPAFVFFTMVFLLCVYAALWRQAYSRLVDFVLNVQLLMLIIGFCRILSGDPGIVPYKLSSLDKPFNSLFSEVDNNTEELELSSCVMRQDFPVEVTSLDSVSADRVRYCRFCSFYVKKFDHHCPAFGNCIGQRNHFLFIVLLAWFIMCEASYAAYAFPFVQNLRLKIAAKWIGLTGNLAASTMLFSILQVVWQVFFLMWHLYCICVNITTDEWINWKKYPEFCASVPDQLGNSPMGTRFVNPYDKGILQNLKEFLRDRG